MELGREIPERLDTPRTGHRVRNKSKRKIEKELAKVHRKNGY